MRNTMAKFNKKTKVKRLRRAGGSKALGKLDIYVNTEPLKYKETGQRYRGNQGLGHWALTC